MTKQDQGVPEPRVRLARLLGLLRALGGPRGESTAVWHGAGFTYVLTVTRDPRAPDEIDLDFDPNADHLDELVQQIHDALTVQP